MSIAARRRAAVLVPWIAFAAVTVFAIAQVRARRGERSHAASTARAPSTPAAAPSPAAVPAPATALPPVTDAAAAAEDALDKALAALAEARAEASTAGRERAAARGRTEAAEARLAAAQARSRALEAEVERLRAAAPPAREEAAGAGDRVAGWVEAVAGGNGEPASRALADAAAATGEEIARLAELLAADYPARAEPVARLAAVLPEGDATDALVAALLTDERAQPATVGLVGAAALRRDAVVESLLADAAAPVLSECLAWIAGGAEDLGDDAKARFAGAVANRLEAYEAPDLVVAARAAGLLRLPGAAVRLSVLLGHDDPAVRAAAAYALSRVPDLDLVRADAVKRLSGLLLDPSAEVRTAGALLAETLVGGAVAYDPAASEAARREAVDAILARLSP